MSPCLCHSFFMEALLVMMPVIIGGMGGNHVPLRAAPAKHQVAGTVGERREGDHGKPEDTKLRQAIENALKLAGYNTADFQLITNQRRELSELTEKGIIGNFTFYTALIRTSIPNERQAVAVGSDGTVLLVPQNITRLFSNSFKATLSKKNAIRIAELYATLSACPPETCVLLKTPEQIRKLLRTGQIPVDVRARIKPPAITRDGDGFTIRFCQHYSVGGIVEEVTINLSAEGNMTGLDRRAIGSRIGGFDIRQ